tara:strand:+ start:3156 stop:3638 length:483 start_codon:yes stop_codon:yes gene_type:complete
MAHKLSEAKFSFIPVEGNHGREIAKDLIENQEFLSFCKQFYGKRLSFWVKEMNIKQTKENMFEYYHRVVLDVARNCFSDLGWPSVDKVSADYLLKNEVAKIFIVNEKTGEELVTTKDKASMSHSELHRYISDCIDWLAVENGYSVPDAYSFKNPGFKPVK